MLGSLRSEITQLFSYYNLLLLLQGLAATFALSIIGCLTGFLAGSVMAVVRVGRAKVLMPLRATFIAYGFLLRRIPFLVTLMLVFFASQAIGAEVSTFAVAALSVCLIASAYLGEIVRSGLESVHANQWEAAQALNFSFLQILRLVIVPQAWRVIMPPAFAFFVMFIKDTSLASQIGVMELTSAGKVLSSKGYSSWLVYATVLMLYFALSYPVSRLGKRLETKIATTGNH